MPHYGLDLDFSPPWRTGAKHTENRTPKPQTVTFSPRLARARGGGAKSGVESVVGDVDDMVAVDPKPSNPVPHCVILHTNAISHIATGGARSGPPPVATWPPRGIRGGVGFSGIFGISHDYYWFLKHFGLSDEIFHASDRISANKRL